MFEALFETNTTRHIYSLAATGLHTKSRDFTSRLDAEHAMHKLMHKYGLHIVDMYDDKHFKTYICNEGIRFYINRI